MRRIALALLLTSSVAYADSAKDHFARGQSLYDATRYEAALHEFEQAQSLHPAPALLYDMAKCLERLGRTEEASQAYEQYIATTPDDADDARKRLTTLRSASLLPVHLVETPAPLPSKRKWIAPGVVGGAAVVFLATGAGLLGSASLEYDRLERVCSPRCDDSTWSGLPEREVAGWVFTGLAGVAAAVDIALIVHAKRHR